MSWRAFASTLCAAAVALLLAGCSSLPFFSKKDDKPAPEASADRAVYSLEVEAPSDLRKLLQTYLDLARFQNAPATDSINTVELDRLAAAAPSQARTLLET